MKTSQSPEAGSTRPISSFHAFTRFIEKEITEDRVLFRGQREDRPLVPKVGRIKLPNKILPTEESILEDFKRLSVPFLRKEPLTNWDWLALAQHHGLPTRLLDWSLNPLVALWFTVRRPAEQGAPGVVWVFKPNSEDFCQKGDEPFTGERTKVFNPNHISERLRAQSGYFTVHKHTGESRGFIPFEKITRYKPQLTKLSIEASAFAEIRYRLDQYGINQSALFPDIDGLCAHIAWLNSELTDEGKLARREKRKSWDIEEAAPD